MMSSDPVSYTQEETSGTGSQPAFLISRLLRSRKRYPVRVALGGPARHTLQYVCAGLGRAPCQGGVFDPSRRTLMRNAG